ncbi:MAG: hypothetical protein ILP14_07015, partial [Oscillospiraceae bacterium]|nr:hypothetical protein [Oscillospiraceae bacterium]
IHNEGMMIMVRIENMFREGNLITLDCFEEGNKEKGHHVIFDIDTFEIKNDATNNIYVRQSIAKAWNYVIEGEPLPREAYSYWC